jgi:RNA polymerase primary sigma factor
MAHVRTGKVRAFLRSAPSGAFDQYLLDIQKLPMISDPEEEKRLARRALSGDQESAERLVTANLRFVISYVKRYQDTGWICRSWWRLATRGCSRRCGSSTPTMA